MDRTARIRGELVTAIDALERAYNENLSPQFGAVSPREISKECTTAARAALRVIGILRHAAAAPLIEVPEDDGPASGVVEITGDASEVLGE